MTPTEEAKTNVPLDVNLLKTWRDSNRDPKYSNAVHCMLKTVRSHGLESSTVREIATLRKLKNVPHIVPLKNYLATTEAVGIVLEKKKYTLKEWIDQFHQFRIPSEKKPIMKSNSTVTIQDVKMQDIKMQDQINDDPQKTNPTKQKASISVDAIRSVMYQLILGVKSMHDHGLLHRDLKPENSMSFLLNDPTCSFFVEMKIVLICAETRKLFIADFGSSIPYQINATKFHTNITSIWFRPLDVFLGNHRYSTDMDVWSIGMIFACMILGRPLISSHHPKHGCVFELLELFGTPLKTQSDEDTAQRKIVLGQNQYYDDFFQLPWYRTICETLPFFPGIPFVELLSHFKSVQGMDLLTQLLILDPKQRITLEKALQHPFFDPIRFQPELFLLDLSCFH